MQINFEQAQIIMNFLNKAKKNYRIEKYITYSYMSREITGNLDDTLRFMSKQIERRPDVYESALKYKQTNLMANPKEDEMAKKKYEEFKEYYSKSQQQDFDFK